MPIPWIGATIVGGPIAVPFTFLVGRRLRGDFAAVGLLVTAVMANLLVTNYRPVLNGAAGLSLVPAPLQGEYNPQSQGYQWLYAAVTLVLAAAVYWLVRRVTESPYGRSLRAMRDNDVVADSLGKNLLSLRTAMLVLGGALAGLSGAILVGFITLWAPSAWGYAETIVLFAAVIIGGAGNHRGAVLGAILVPVALRGGHQVHPQHPREARPGRRPAVGGDRAADRALPLVPAAGGAARAPSPDRSRPAEVGHAERGCCDAGWHRAGARAVSRRPFGTCSRTA